MEELADLDHLTGHQVPDTATPTAKRSAGGGRVRACPCRVSSMSPFPLPAVLDGGAGSAAA
uniref:Uncharacterized protein n=1 Tax=Setaria italica TaxID=4555 RepID=K3ZPC2_SETIT